MITSQFTKDKNILKYKFFGTIRRKTILLKRYIIK